MAKKSKQARLYAKQQQRLKKIEKKAKQKGIQVDLTETKAKKENATAADVAAIKKEIKELKAKPAPTNKEPQTTNNKLKLTDKQLRKAVAKRKQIPSARAAKIRKIPSVSKETKPKRKQETEELRSKLTPKSNITVPDKTNRSSEFFADTVIALYRAELKHFPRKAEPLIGAWLDGLIAAHGKEDVATMLQQGAEEGHVLTYEIAYDSEKMAAYISDMLDYLPEMTDWYKADVLDQFEEWAEFF